MTTLSISLPPELKEFVDAQATEHGLSSAGEYVHTLIRDAQERAAKEKLETLLVEGLESGPAIEASSDYWAEKEARLVEKHQTKKET